MSALRIEGKIMAKYDQYHVFFLCFIVIIIIIIIPTTKPTAYRLSYRHITIAIRHDIAIHVF